jgi:hypothetical protein
VRVATLVRIVQEVLAAIEADFIDANDNFKGNTPEMDAKLAARVVDIVQSHGVDVDDRVERVIKSLPLILSFFG